MDNKSISPAYCLLACSLSLLIFSDASLAASVDTGKVQPKITKIPPPTVKAPVQPQPQPPKTLISPTVITGTVTTSPPPQAPKAIVKTPTYNVRPKTQVKLPPPTVRPNTNVKHPPQTVQPRVNVPTPNQKVQTLDPRYAPKMAPGPSATTPRPGQDLHAPVATPGSPATNALGGSKIDSQTLGRIQNIQEAATAAEVFEQIRIMKEAETGIKDLHPAEGLPGSRVADTALGRAEFEIDHADTNAIMRDLYGLNTPEGLLRRPGPDYSAGSGGPGMKQQPTLGGYGTSNASDAGIIGAVVGGVNEVVTKGFDGQKDGVGSQTARIVLGWPLIGAAIWTGFQMQEAADIAEDPRNLHPLLTIEPTEEPTAPAPDPTVEEGVDTNGDGEADSSPPPTSPPPTTSQPNDNASKGSDGCNWNPHWGRCMNKQRTVKEKQDDRTSPTRGDADTGESTSVSGIGPEAVTNPSEFHSRGGTSVSGSRMWEGITESGGTPEPPPPPSGANIDEALGAFD